MKAAETSPEHFDLLGLEPDTMSDPYALYRALLNGAPVFKEPTYGVYLVTRYDDIQEMKRQPQRFSNCQPTGPLRFPSFEELSEDAQEQLRAAGVTSLSELAPTENTDRVVTLLAADPPVHTRYRGMTNKVLNARSIKQWEPKIRKIADDLIDAMVEKETVEWVGDFAHPLPLKTVGAILGVPIEDDALLDELFGGRDVGDTIGNPVVAAEQLLDGTISHNLQVYTDFFSERITALRSKPVEGDFLSDLIQTKDEEGNCLNDEEILSIVSHFQAAGHETSTKMITQAMYQLANDAELWREVQQDQSLIPNLCEEALRFEAPVQGLFQIAREDVEVGGVEITKGSMLMTLYAAANRDPSKFESPDEFNIHRKNVRSHLSFGAGIHSCMGRALARAEGLLSFQSVFEGLDAVKLTPDINTLERTSSYILRGLRELHIDIVPRHG